MSMFNTIFIICLLISPVAFIACSSNTQMIVVSTQIPGNNTLLIEHECSEAKCGTFIQTAET